MIDEDIANMNRNRKSGRCKNLINVDMIPVKLFYLLWGGITSTHIIYQNPFLVSVGIPKNRVGAITGLTFAVSTVFGPIWGFLTDYTGRPRLLLTIICLSSALWIASLPVVARAFTQGPPCYTKLSDLSPLTSTHLNITANTTTHDNFKVPGCNEDNPDKLFYIFLILMAVGSIFNNTIPCFIEATALKAIKVSPNNATYGGQRIFGAIGGFCSVYLTAVLVDRYKVQEMSPFAMSFFVYAPFALLALPVGTLVIRQYEKRMEQLENKKSYQLNGMEKENYLTSTSTTPETGILRQVCQMFRQFDVIVILMTALIAGLAFNQFIYFTMFLITERMQVSKTEAGFIFSAVNLSNFFMFPLSDKLIRLLRGPKIAVVIGMFAHCARQLVMSYTTTYYVMLSIQLLHALNFALLWSAMMNYIHKISTMKIKTTMIMILVNLHFGLAPFLANTIGGIIHQNYNCQLLFRWNGLLCGAWGVLLVFYYGVRYIRKKRGTSEVARKYSKEAALFRDDVFVSEDEEQL